MADITDNTIPEVIEVIKLVGESLRPMAERTRGTMAELAALEATIARIVAAGTVPNDGTLLAEGRESEGIAPLSGAEIHGLLAIRSAILALSTPQAVALIERGCVRPLRIQIT